MSLPPLIRGTKIIYIYDANGNRIRKISIREPANSLLSAPPQDQAAKLGRPGRRLKREVAKPSRLYRMEDASYRMSWLTAFPSGPSG
ncbi:MAG: hypothetical protein NC238_02095 [Dehalobacter sp.]|nr:hypothetical protein [Dehalobacter sp.]